MTPLPVAKDIVSKLNIKNGCRILEPSCGNGAFLSAIGETANNGKLFGMEIDVDLAKRARVVAPNANVFQGDFFRSYLSGKFFGSDVSLGEFDIIMGNPPFGGVFDKSIEDTLDSRLGHRFGMKVKKETYAFFIVACVDLLRNGGQLAFICSDSVLTIPTMKGLRNFLMRSGKVEIRNLEEFSDETAYPMIVLNFIKGGECGKVVRNGIAVDAIENTPNLSWGNDAGYRETVFQRLFGRLLHRVKRHDHRKKRVVCPRDRQAKTNNGAFAIRVA